MTEAHHERVWYSHRTTGDRAYLVTENGKQRIRYDRPSQSNELTTRDFEPSEWIALHEVRPLTEHQMAQVALDADKKLCFFLGMHSLANRTWLSMRDEQRIDWTNNGPPLTAHPLRREQFAMIMSVLRGDE